MSFGYTLDPTYIFGYLPALFSGLIWTIVLTGVGIIGGIALGLAGGLARSSGGPVLRTLVGGAVEVIRSTPLFVQIFFLYFGLPEIGVRLPPFAVGCTAVVLWGAAYNTENFRAGIESVPDGMSEASRSLGFSPASAFMLVTLPLAWRIALPSITNTSIETLKNTALMVAISFPELTTTAVDLVAVSFRVFEVFIVLGAAYLALGAGMSRAFRVLERRLALRA